MSTLTDVVGSVDAVDSNNMINLNRNNNINSDRIAYCKTTSSCVSDADTILSGNGRISMQNTFETVRNGFPFTPSTISILSASIPLSGQILHVVVAQVSASGNFTTGTYLSVVNRNNNLRIFTHIDIVRFTFHAATLRSGHNNRENIRMILCRQRSADKCIITVHNQNRSALQITREVRKCNIKRRSKPCSRNRDLIITNGVVVKSPLVSIIQRRIDIIEVSIEHNRIIMASHRIASNSNSGLHHNIDYCRSRCLCRNTTM